MPDKPATLPATARRLLVFARAHWRIAAVQLVLETRPQGGAAGGGSSREEVVDKLCEELLSKVLAWTHL